jgi:NDP-sugar pyrophosphorylase family protein
MQVVILAGGLGTRMRPITETIPKPMIPVLGRPFLEWQIEMLAFFGFRRFLLLVGYLGRQIEEHFKAHPLPDCMFSFSCEVSPLGTAGALKSAESLLEDEFVLLNGDTYLPIDYRFLCRLRCPSNVLAVVVAHQPLVKTTGLPNGNLTVNRNFRVTSFGKSGLAAGNYIAAGVVLLKKETLTCIPQGCNFSLERKVFPELVRGGCMHAAITSEKFYDIGTPTGLAELQVKLA